MVDTPERSKDEDAKRFRALWRLARDIVLFVGADGRILDANDAALHTYGYTREELCAMRVHELRAPDTREHVDTQMERAFTDGLLFETVHVRKDGTPVPVEVSSQSAEIEGELLLLSVIRDLTERKQMQARLAEADRLASVGTLAAGVAHEINNPLSYAMTSMELALRLLTEAELGGGALVGDDGPLARARRAVSLALDGAHRVRAIVRDLKTLSRTDAAETGPIDVRRVLETCLNVASHELRDRASVVREYGDVPLVRANEGRMVQVFLNLVVNAAHALPQGRSGNEIKLVTRTDQAGRAVVEVHDNGIGIPLELQRQVFEPFFTTKARGEGTGLGLFLSRSIVTAMGGTLELSSVPRVGTVFRVTFPGVTVLSTQQAQRNSGEHSMGLRVLVIDDEPAIAQVLVAALEEHEVVAATSGEQALAILAEAPDFDVIVCDMAMPAMTGLELHARVARERPQLANRFVFMTGGALGRAASELLKSGDHPCVLKPFSLRDIRREIGRVAKTGKSQHPPS